MKASTDFFLRGCPRRDDLTVISLTATFHGRSNESKKSLHSIKTHFYTTRPKRRHRVTRLCVHVIVLKNISSKKNDKFRDSPRHMSMAVIQCK